jgi:hypothetical protein
VREPAESANLGLELPRKAFVATAMDAVHAAVARFVLKGQPLWLGLDFNFAAGLDLILWFLIQIFVLIPLIRGVHEIDLG